MLVSVDAYYTPATKTGLVVIGDEVTLGNGLFWRCAGEKDVFLHVQRKGGRIVVLEGLRTCVRSTLLAMHSENVPDEDSL